jgi:alpha-tubulin suppressor-like RCC1 family protein
VDCWGDGYYGQLGNGMFYTTGNDGSATPVEVEGVGGTGTLTGATSLVSGNGDYCTLLTSREVDCWGGGGFGALGNGTFSNSATPVAVEGVGGTGTLTGVASLVSEGTPSGFCALLTSGGVDCWGNGEDGELGNGTFYNTSSPFGSATPVAVEGVGGTGTLAGVTSLVSGSVNYCALLTSGGVDCWGYGFDGDLGNGTFYRTGNDGSATPVEVE